MDSKAAVTDQQQRLLDRLKSRLQAPGSDGRVLKSAVRDRMNHAAFDALVRKGLLKEEVGTIDGLNGEKLPAQFVSLP